MCLVNDIGKQLQRLWPLLLLLYLPATLLWGLILILHSKTHLDIGQLTGDPIIVLQSIVYHIQHDPQAGLATLQGIRIPRYLGFISNIGVLFWCAATAISLFTYHISRKQPHTLYPPSFFLWCTLLSCMFLAEDFFMLRELFIPWYLGVVDKLIFLAYGALLITFMLRWRHILRQTDYLLLLIALLCFLFSLSVDLLADSCHGRPFLEDAPKFFGIITWAAYHAHTATQQLSASQAPQH